MATRFVCLGNSYKEGGRCLAGIELNAANQPLVTSGRPLWIRPICHTQHGEIPSHLVSHIKLLDVVQLNVTGRPNTDYQHENAFFTENTISVIGQYPKAALTRLSETANPIFGNYGKAVSNNSIGLVKSSLVLVEATQFEVTDVVQSFTGNPQMRMVFSVAGHQYDFPITDPDFMHKRKLNADLLDNVSKVYLTLSLGVNFNDWYFKLVAAILY